jgi:hypothetical protein
VRALALLGWKTHGVASASLYLTPRRLRHTTLESDHLVIVAVRL